MTGSAAAPERAEADGWLNLWRFAKTFAPKICNIALAWELHPILTPRGIERCKARCTATDPRIHNAVRDIQAKLRPSDDRYAAVETIWSNPELLKMLHQECEMRQQAMRHAARHLIDVLIPDRVRLRLVSGGYEIEAKTPAGQRVNLSSADLAGLDVDVRQSTLLGDGTIYSAVRVRRQPLTPVVRQTSKAPPPIRPIKTSVHIITKPPLDYVAAPGSPQSINPPPIIPPEWLRLVDGPWWVDRVHHVSSDAITRELSLATRTKIEIRHRVFCEPRDRTYAPSLPPGLVRAAWHGVWSVFVVDWGLAEADWQAGTVGGWEQNDGTRERLAIEVPWEAVDHFVRIRLRGWKRDAAEVSELITRSGAQGRPSSVSNLVRPELARRAAAGETLRTVKAEAEALSQWLATTHAHQPQVSGPAIENSLRRELRAAVGPIRERDIK